jgi:hypothetical protein
MFNISKWRWMNMKKTHIRIPLLLLGLLFLIFPAIALINTIPTGGTVFIGEQGLDITGPTGVSPSEIGWWASGADITTTSPDYKYSVSDPTKFYVSPSEFGTHTGSWYALPAKTLAFNVVDPKLEIRIEDTTVGVDVTGKWVPTDDNIRFRIDTNLIPIAQRTGSVPITIKVQDPSGGIYTSLLNSAGVPTSIVDIAVAATPYYTDSIWSTSQRTTYSPGTYIIWAECNVNSMNDNYNLAGKTVSQKTSLLNQDQNPLISGNYGTKTPTTAIPVTTNKITQIPSSTLPTTKPVSVQSPVTIKTSETMIVQTGTQIPAPSNQPPTAIPQPTKSPGFEVILTCVAGLFVAMRFNRAD